MDVGLVIILLRRSHHWSPVWDILFLLFIVAAFLWSLYTRSKGDQRESAIRAWAQQRGYRYEQSGGVALGDLRVFRKDFVPFYYNVVRGNIGGLAFDMFDLKQEYISSGKNTPTIWTTAVSFLNVDINVGEFAIHPAGFTRKLQDWLGEAEMALDGADPEFSRRYTLRSQMPEVARVLIAPAITSVIANTERELCIEGRGNFLIVYAPYSGDRLFGDATIPAKDWENFLDSAQRIAGAILRSAARIEIVSES